MSALKVTANRGTANDNSANPKSTIQPRLVVVDRDLLRARVLQYGALGKEIDGSVIKAAGAITFLGVVCYRWLAPALKAT
jgi:hypothetical protein